METLRGLFQKADPNAQLRKCNVLIRSNIRKLDRDISAVKAAESKTRQLILQADRRAQKDPSRRAQAANEARDFTRELIRTRKVQARLVTGKAQLNSVQMQVNEAFAMRKIEGSIRASVGVMKDINQLIRLPDLAGTMRELSVELMKAGVIEEMVGDVLPETGDALDEDVEADEEVEAVLGEILNNRMAKTGAMPNVSVLEEKDKVTVQQEEEEDEENTEAMMDQMRNRLEALRS